MMRERSTFEQPSLSFISLLRLPRSTLFPYTTLFRSHADHTELELARQPESRGDDAHGRSEEHTSELQSRQYLVCRLLLEKKKTSPLTTLSRRFSHALVLVP